MKFMKPQDFMMPLSAMNTDREIIIASFTQKGISLALRLSAALVGRVFAPERLASEHGLEVIGSLTEWAGVFFRKAGAFVFVGACGIAVRAVAPHITSKLKDPAVIVIDEAGRFVVPILSGHVGGANELAREIAGLLGAQAVITTATDVNNLPAVDEWAVKHNCEIQNPDAVKHVSGSLLEGHSVGVAVSELDVPAPFPVTLWLRPRVLVLGAGCHRGISPEMFESSAADFLNGAGVSMLSLKSLASIDLKASEPAMIDFSKKHNIPFITFGAGELQAVQGRFSSSERVMYAVGADNVCERAAVLAAGNGAVLLRSKCIYEGITFALARSVIE